MKWFREIIFLLIGSCCLSEFSAAQQKGFSIRIVQEDAVHSPEPGTSTILLQQKTFKIQVLLQHLDGVYVFASLHDSLYNLPVQQAVPGLSNIADSLDWHRFNKKIVLLDSGRVVGTKTVKQLYFVADQESVKLKENKQPLYLFFVATVKVDENGSPVQELYRRRIKIEWREED